MAKTQIFVEQNFSLWNPCWCIHHINSEYTVVIVQLLDGWEQKWSPLEHLTVSNGLSSVKTI